MFKRILPFLIILGLMAPQAMADGLSRSDLDFAFKHHSADADIVYMTEEQMLATEGEWAAAAVRGAVAAGKAYQKAKKVKKAAGRNGGNIKPHRTTKNGKTRKDAHTKPRPGRTNTKQRSKRGWRQR